MFKMKKLVPFCLSTLLVAGLVLGGGQAALANEFFVNSGLDTKDAKTGDGYCKDSIGLCSLRAAIEEASNLSGSHTIVLYSGYNYLNPLINYGELKVPANPKASSITIQSAVSYYAGQHISGISTPPTESAWIVANKRNKSRVLNIGYGANVTLKDIVIHNGYSKFGGGIFNSGNLTLDGCWINENEVSDYLVQEDGATATYGGGAGVFNKGVLTLKGYNIVSHNTANTKGGGIANFMESSVSNSGTIFEGNSPDNCSGSISGTACP